MCPPQSKCQQVRRAEADFLTFLKVFFSYPYYRTTYLIEFSRSVLENLDLDQEYGLIAVTSVLTTSLKILSYRPPVRLIRAKIYTMLSECKSHSAPCKSFVENMHF